MLPRHKLAICIPPKSGVVSIHYLLLAILGNHPEDVCGCGHDDDNGVHPKFGCLGMEALRSYSLPMYEGLVFVNDDLQFDTTAEKGSATQYSSSSSSSSSSSRGRRLLAEAFTDPDWQVTTCICVPLSTSYMK
jgi:hypothetical protein